MVSATKDPAKVRAGLIGARARWGDQPARVVRLDDLTAPQRRLVLALVAAAREEAATEVQSPAAAELEGHGNDRPAT